MPSLNVSCISLHDSSITIEIWRPSELAMFSNEDLHRAGGGYAPHSLNAGAAADSELATNHSELATSRQP